MMGWQPPTDGGIRQRDPMGSGAFGASRGSRLHAGIDYLAEPGEQVYSPCRAIVVRHGKPYSDPDKSHYDLIELLSSPFVIRLMYVSPIVPTNKEVLRGQVIGHAQDIAAAYGNGMQNHVHFDVRIRKEHVIFNGGLIDADPYINPSRLIGWTNGPI